VLQNADGSFAALIQTIPGENEIEVHARSSDGAQRTRKITLRCLPEAPPQRLSPNLLAQRNRLVQNRLEALRQRNLGLEAEEAEGLRRALEQGVEAERAARRLLRPRIEEEKIPAAQGAGAPPQVPPRR
jgi:hypothetical protein